MVGLLMALLSYGCSTPLRKALGLCLGSCICAYVVSVLAPIGGQVGLCVFIGLVGMKGSGWLKHTYVGR